VIALLSGVVAVRRGDHVVVDCHGVGFRLAVSAETLRQVPAVGHAVTLHTHLIMREDGISLYGFAAEDERDLFLMLLGVQSVGPKVALEVLSGGPTRELLRALAAGDAARFMAVKGIGKRTAERIIVELREKVGVGDLDPLSGGGVVISRADDPRSLAREGLTGLGYSLEEAEALLAGLDAETPEELLSAALRSARR
jgi:Holliday junction DNA helicase RuvA